MNENESIRKEKESAVLKHTIERNLKELHIVLDRLSDKIAKEISVVTKIDLFEVEEDKSILPTSLDKLLADSASLGLLVEDMTQLEGKVDEAVSKANKLIRDANIFLKLSYSSSTDAASSSLAAVFRMLFLQLFLLPHRLLSLPLLLRILLPLLLLNPWCQLCPMRALPLSLRTRLWLLLSWYLALGPAVDHLLGLRLPS